MFRSDLPCCAKLAEVMRGPEGGAEPTLFLDDDDRLTMVIGMIDTPGGLGLFDHAVHYCPFCGAPVQSAAETQAKAKH